MNDRVKALLPFLLDLIIPIGGYFLLHTVFGLSAFWALTIGGLATMVNAIVNTVRRGRLDSFGLLVVFEVALSVVLLFVSRDPRVLLLKPAFYVAVGGLWALGTLRLAKPLAYESGKPFATKGDPTLVAAYERAFDQSPRFRSALRSVTAVWGVAFLLDAVLRVVIVYRFTPDQINDSLVLSQVPLLALLVLAIVFTRLRMRSVRPELLRHREHVSS
ncbi:VC0807 family protein [Labedaea rhizosphaerae]|uniref:Intracellular septation protein A n=1 Tax=Labedaea rhizosphaerae TaxID=598644 RepID=A0A4V3CZL4_LABRH|nr:VC0807 family protein [Labedaea rhizosphaerae]TDQ00181.1 hypothetical protein EV186_10242 [Labedaea rhizosphaerae]